LPAVFSRTRNASGIGRETFSPGVVRKVLTVAAEVRSFARAAKVLAAVADNEISSRHAGRLALQTGERLAAENRQRAADHQAKKLSVEVTNLPEVAVVEVDGGRIRTREESQGPGTHEPVWKESKNGLCCRMSSQTHASDPAPELPSSLAVHAKVKRLAQEIHGSSAGNATNDCGTANRRVVAFRPAKGIVGIAPQKLPFAERKATIRVCVEQSRRAAAHVPEFPVRRPRLRRATGGGSSPQGL
jgi:hypothetical protein